MRRVVVVEACVRAGAVAVGDASGRTAGGFLFVEGKGVDVGAMGGAGLGAVVEDPDNLRNSLLVVVETV